MNSRTLTYGTGTIAALLLGCADAGGSAAVDAGSLESLRGGPVLEVPARGVQLATVGREIAPGHDEEWCEVVELPGDADDEYFVAGTEIAMSPYSHHLTISVAPPGSTSLADEPLHEPVRCAGGHELGTDLMQLTGSAKPYTENVLPEGIGFALRGGQRLVFDYHAYNTSEAPIRTEHRLNLHFVDRVDKRARTFGFYNQYFQVPAGTERSFVEECAFKDEVLVWSLTRHTHRLGKDFRVWWAGGERDGELIWTSKDWEQDISFRFPEPIRIPKGVGFRWECVLENPTDELLQFGPLATDEMCILFGQFAAVGDDSEVGSQSCILFAPR